MSRLKKLFTFLKTMKIQKYVWPLPILAAATPVT